MATVEDLERHRNRCLRHGLTATAGGLLLALVPLYETLLGETVAIPVYGAVAAVAAVVALFGVVALALRYSEGFGWVGRLGAFVAAVGLVLLLAGGATGSLDLLGRARPGGGIFAVVGYFLLLVGAVPLGVGLWQSGGSVAGAAMFVLALPIGFVLTLGLRAGLALPSVTAAFLAFGLPVAAGLVLAGLEILFEPPPGADG